MNIPHPLCRLTATVPETARLLGVSVATVDRQVRRGALPVLRVARRRLVTYGDLAERLGCTVQDVRKALSVGWKA